MRRWFVLAPWIVLACAPRAPVETPPARVGRPEWQTPRRAELEENEEGIPGGPDDETEFEFDAEIAPTAPPHLELPDGIAPEPHPALEPYLDGRRGRLAGVDPLGRGLWIYARAGQSMQVHLQREALGELEALTRSAQPVIQAAPVPGRPEWLTVRTDPAGTEDYQIAVIAPPGDAVARPSREGARHGLFRWSPRGERLAFTSNARRAVDMDLYLAAREDLEAPVRAKELRGAWTVTAWADASRLVLRHFRSVHESSLHVYEPSGDRLETLGPAEGVAMVDARPGPDGSFYVLSDRGGEHVGAFRVRAERWEPIGESRAWDVESLAVAPDRTRLATVTNEDGWSVLRSVAPDGTEAVLETPRGVIRALRWTGEHTLAFELSTPAAASGVFVHDVAAGTLTPWTRPVGDTDGVVPELARVPSFDGVEVPTWVYRAPAEGPRPALLWIHGGPEEQSRPSYDPIIQFLARELGVTVVAPNLRGSLGYGRTYAQLDDGRLREDAIRDIGAVLDWLGADDAVDAGRVGIHGASYGGYVVLASLAAYPDRIAAGCDVVGVSSFVTFLENTRPYRRALRRREYGDESDAAMRAFLTSISPLSRADRIRAPLFVAHGANDPRVPVDEALQIADAVRASGAEVWLMVAPDEGHGFSRRANRDAFYRLFARFWERHLLPPVPTAE